MFVCICNAVTDQEIRKAIKEGVSNLGELQRCLGVAANCGQCACTAEGMLEESAPGSATTVISRSA